MIKRGSKAGSKGRQERQALRVGSRLKGAGPSLRQVRPGVPEIGAQASNYMDNVLRGTSSPDEEEDEDHATKKLRS